MDTVFDVAKEQPKRPVQSVQHKSPDFGASEPKKRVLLGSEGLSDMYPQTQRSLLFDQPSSTTSDTNLTESMVLRTRSSTRIGESSSTTSETNLTDLGDLDLSDMEDDSNDDDDSQKSNDPNYEQYYEREKKKVKFIDNHVVSTIDAIGLSDPKAARLLTAVAQALGYDLDDVTVSRSTIRRRRGENRKLIAKAIKKGFKVNL